MSLPDLVAMGPLLKFLLYCIVFLFIGTQLTHFITYLLFLADNNAPRGDVKDQRKRPPPIIPYRVPWLGDAIEALLDLHKYVSSVL